MRQKLSRLVLFFLIASLVALAGYQIKIKFFPKQISSSEIPFGLPAGVVVTVGESVSLLTPPKVLTEKERSLYERALLLLETGDPATALALIQGLLALHPDEPSLLTLLIRTAVERGDEPGSSLLVSAEEQLDRVISNRPKSSRLQIAKAELLLQRGAAVEALERLQTVIASSPQAPEPHLLAARAYLQIGKLDSAKKEARWGISLSPAPTRGTAYSLLAEAYHRNGQLDSARIVTEYALMLHPNLRDLLLLRARLHEYANSVEAASAIYARLDQLYPKDRAVALAKESLGNKQPPLPGNVGCMGDWSAWLDDLSIRYGGDPEAAALLSELQARLVPKQNTFSSKTFQQTATGEEVLDLTEVVENAAKGAIESEIDRYGHFQVRWGATEKQFLSAVDSSLFTRLSPSVWRTERRNGGDLHQITLFFDSVGFSKVQLIISDTTGQPGDLLGRTLRALTRRSGNPRATGETNCPGFYPFQGFVWENSDDFSLLTQFKGRDRQARMVRVDPRLLPTPFSLCAVADWLVDWRPNSSLNSRKEQ